MRDRLFQLAREEGGQSVVEFAITFSLLMTFVFAFMELCLMFYTYGMISESVREGSRYAAMHGAGCTTAASVSCTTTANGVNLYVSQLGYPNLAGGTMTVSTTFPDGSQTAGNRVTVSATYVFPITMKLVPPSAWTLSTSSTLTILQ